MRPGFPSKPGPTPNARPHTKTRQGRDMTHLSAGPPATLASTAAMPHADTDDARRSNRRQGRKRRLAWAPPPACKRAAHVLRAPPTACTSIGAEERCLAAALARSITSPVGAHEPLDDIALLAARCIIASRSPSRARQRGCCVAHG